jgi:hypothetical protein
MLSKEKNQTFQIIERDSNEVNGLQTNRFSITDGFITPITVPTGNFHSLSWAFPNRNNETTFEQSPVRSLNDRTENDDP